MTTPPDERAGMADGDLIGLIYEGVMESDPWASFLHALRTQLHANSAMLMLGRPDASGLARDIDDADWQVSTIKQLYYSRFVDQNPIRYDEMVPGRVYSMFDFIARERFLRTPYYLDFCRHLGIEMALIACIGEPGDTPCWLNVARREQQGDFRPAEIALIEDLIPHLHRALRMREAVCLSRQQTSAYMGALDSARLCTVLLDGERRIVGLNEEAERLFAQSTAVTIRNGVMTLTDRTDQARFTALWSSFIGGEDDTGYGVMTAGAEGDNPVNIMVRRSDRLPLPGGRSAIAAIAYLKDPSAPLQPQVSAISALFSLKPTEARLAAALAQGADIREASIQLGMTEQTARTYVKRILQKTGTRRQSELVQMISTSLAVLN